LAEQRIGDAVERRDHRPDAPALDVPEFGGQRRRLEECCNAKISVSNLIRDHEIGSFACAYHETVSYFLLRNCCGSSLHRLSRLKERRDGDPHWPRARDRTAIRDRTFYPEQFPSTQVKM
jgi:hypothetical protein